MTLAFQKPLFYQVELLSEVNSRQRLAIQSLQTSKARSQKQRIADAYSLGEFHPLTLAPYGRVTKGSNGVAASAPPVEFFTFSHVFSGDEQLWHMDPGADDEDHPLGEIIQSELILVIKATSLEAARAQYVPVLAQITALIAFQTEQVAAFNENLRHWLEDHVSGTTRLGSGLLH